MTDNKWLCKICIEEANDPVVTKCGHLFCWECIYEWSITKESDLVPCPTCHAEVNVKELIPLYANQEQHQ